MTLEDFLAQMEQVRKLGSMSKLLGMIPGMGEMREQINSIDEREVDRIAAIIKSMTPAERTDPKIINGSRRARIANGAGVTVTEVNGLLDRFAEAQKMMKQMSRGGGFPGMPGMPGTPGMGKKSRGKAGRKGKGKAARSGNPARSANPARSGNPARSNTSPATQAGSVPAAFGGPGAGAADAGTDDAADLDLPPELRDFLSKRPN
jgi:signal recognition particle subunit SRP54